MGQINSKKPVYRGYFITEEYAETSGHFTRVKNVKDKEMLTEEYAETSGHFTRVKDKKERLTEDELFHALAKITNRSEAGVKVMLYTYSLAPFLERLLERFPDLGFLQVSIRSFDLREERELVALQKFLTALVGSNFKIFDLEAYGLDGDNLDIFLHEVSDALRQSKSIQKFSLVQSWTYMRENQLNRFCNRLTANTSITDIKILNFRATGPTEAILAWSPEITGNTKWLQKNRSEKNPSLGPKFLPTLSFPNKAILQDMVESNSKVQHIWQNILPVVILMINIKRSELPLPLEIWMHIFSFLRNDFVLLKGLMEGVSRGIIEERFVSRSPIRFKLDWHQDKTCSIKILS